MKTLKDLLVPTLRTQFPEHDIEFPEEAHAIARIPAAHPEVGEMRIWDYGDEVMLEVGSICHQHFGDYGNGTPEERAARICADVVEFVEAILSDRVLLFRTRLGSGGMYPLDAEEPMRPRAGTQVYTWSGPEAPEGEQPKS